MGLPQRRPLGLWGCLLFRVVGCLVVKAAAIFGVHETKTPKEPSCCFYSLFLRTLSPQLVTVAGKTGDWRSRRCYDPRACACACGSGLICSSLSAGEVGGPQQCPNLRKRRRKDVLLTHCPSGLAQKSQHFVFTTIFQKKQNGLPSSVWCLAHCVVGLLVRNRQGRRIGMSPKASNWWVPFLANPQVHSLSTNKVRTQGPILSYSENWGLIAPGSKKSPSTYPYATQMPTREGDAQPRVSYLENQVLGETELDPFLLPKAKGSKTLQSNSPDISSRRVPEFPKTFGARWFGAGRGGED